MSNPIGLALEQLLPGQKILPALISTADNYVLRSKQKISNLRPDEEAARYLICAKLAVEEKAPQLGIAPNASIPMPIAPKIYNKLVVVFRNALGLNSYKSSPTPSPRKMKTTPRKQMIENRETSPSPSPSPSPKKRGLPKSSDPMSRDVERMAAALSASDAVLAAVVRGYKQYHNLVRERWGLLCGLFYVTISRAHPELFRTQGQAKMYNRIAAAAPTVTVNSEKVQEWASWAERIVGEQSWVRSLAIEDWIAPVVAKKKRTSGIGNMIPYTLDFANEERKREYDEWEMSIQKKLKTA